MKTLKQIKELYTQNTKDGKEFVNKHKVAKTPDANKNGDDVFNASNVKDVKRQPAHGYDPGDDEKVYEEVELHEIGYQSSSGDSYSPSAGGRPKPISIFNTSRSSNLNPAGSKPDVVHLQNKLKAVNPKEYSRSQAVLNRPLTTQDIERTPEGSAGSRTTGRPLFSAVKTQKQIQANPIFKKEEFELHELDDAAGGYPVNKKPNTTPPPKDPKAKPQVTAKKPTHYVVMPGEKVVEETEEVDLDEVLKPSMGADAYIKDFVHSKNPKFAGKSKKERIKQALGAFYAAKRGE